MADLNIDIELASIFNHSKNQERIHEAVLFFCDEKKNEKSNKAKKEKNLPTFPTLIGTGTRLTHRELLSRLGQDEVLPAGGQVVLYQQREQWGVDQIIFYSLGLPLKSQDSSKTPSLFCLESHSDCFRMAGGDLVRQLIQSLKKKEGFLLIDISRLTEPGWENLVAAFLEGLYLGGYQYFKYKKNPSKVRKLRITILLNADARKTLTESQALPRAKIAAEGVGRARDLVNTPPNDLNSEVFVKEAKKIASSLKISLQVFNNAQLKKMEMNALLAVNAGSRNEAKLAVLDNRYSGKGKTVLLVGKGVLFDSGGLSLKPSASMNGMKMDMAGGAAVLSAFEALVKMKVKARVITVIPLTDNMTGGNAMKIGDVIRTHSGKTVEVLNTDAEGRLILCDALSYGIRTYRPDYILDLATLTGACMVALGTYYSGLFTSGDDLAEKLLRCSKATDEPLWRLPLDNLYSKDLQSDIADLKNIGGSYGGAITAAKFLEQFIPEKYRHYWAHLDIAPVMDYTQTKGYQVKGGSGFGVRLIIDFVNRLIRET